MFVSSSQIPGEELLPRPFAEEETEAQRGCHRPEISQLLSCRAGLKPRLSPSKANTLLCL